MIIGLLLRTALVPLVVGVAALALVRALAPGQLRRRLGAPVALGLGYLAGHVAIAGVPSWPPLDTTQGLVYLAVAALAVGALEGGVELHRGAEWLVRLALVGAVMALTLHPVIRYRWGAIGSVVWLAALAAVMLLLWAAYRWVGERLGAGALGVSWTLAFAGSGILLLVARTALLAQLAVVVAILVIAVSPAARLVHAALPLLGGLYWALLLNGAFYAELSASAAVAAAASPLGAVLALLPWARDRGWRGALLAGLGVLVVLAPFVVRSVAGNLSPQTYQEAARRGVVGALHLSSAPEPARTLETA